MDFKDWIATFSALAAYLVWKTAKRSLSYQLYLGFLSEYKSKEMLAALEGLRRFECECTKRGKNFHAIYNIKKKNLLDKIAAPEKHEKAVNIIEDSLHHQRRLVAHFYHAIFVAAKGRMIPKRMLFGFWGIGDINIIPQVLENIKVDYGKQLDRLWKMINRYENKPWKYLWRFWWWILDWLP